MQINQSAPMGVGMAPEAFTSKLLGQRIFFESDGGDGGGTQATTTNETGGGGADQVTTTNETGVGSTDDYTALKDTISKVRKEASNWEKQYKQLQQSFEGIDPQAAKQAMDNFKRLQQEQEAWNQKEQELTNRLTEDHQRRLGGVQEQMQVWQGKYQDLLSRTLAQQAYEAAAGRAGGSEDGTTFFDSLFANVKSYLRLNDKDQLEVIDRTGARIFSKKNPSDPMSPAEFFAGYANHPVFGHCFKAEGNSKGGGMQPGSGSYRANGTVKVINRNDIATLAEPGVIEALAKGDGSVIVR